MPDLGTQLRDDIDAAAAPIALDEVEGHPLVPLRRRRHPRRWLAVAAVLVLIVGAGAFLASRRDEPGRRIVTRPGPFPDPVAWLTPFGSEQPLPAVPDGWKVVDYDAARFAVPRDWQLIDECGGLQQVQSDDIVVIPAWGPIDPQFCTAVPVPPTVHLSLDEVPRGLFGPVDDYDFDVTGPLADRIRGHVHGLGRAPRCLQQGPVAPTVGWRTVSFNGVGLLVPPAWPVVDLSTADLGFYDYLDCAENTPTFPTDEPARAYVEDGLSMCNGSFRGIDLHPGDGVWMRRAGADPTRVAARGRIAGLNVVVGDLRRYDQDPVIELIADDGEHWTYVSIGVGDIPVARAILRSLHRG